jgi:hypothetical protein
VRSECNRACQRGLRTAVCCSILYIKNEQKAKKGEGGSGVEVHVCFCLLAACGAPLPSRVQGPAPVRQHQHPTYHISQHPARGRQKKKSRGPPWWVGGSEYEKGLGSDLFFRYFFIVFLNSPHRETPKNVIKKIEKKSVLDFWSNFL